MNKNALIQKCLGEMALNRAKAQNIAYANLSFARKNADFVKVDLAEREVIFQIGKLRAANKRSKELEQKLKDLKAQKEQILKKLNLKPTDLEPSYSCKKCNDLGYVGPEFCDCLKKKLNALLMQECGIEKDKLADFKDFDEKIITNQTQKTELLKIKKKFEGIASSFPSSSPKFIVLSGKTGVGKTFVTECLAKNLLEKNYLVSVVTAFGMNNLFLSYHTTFDDNKSTYLDALIDPDVLVIDDLGTEPLLKNVTKEYLLLILSERSRQNKLTAITTNLEPDQILERYNERIFSRLFNKREAFLAKIDGSDLRLSK